MKVAKAIGQGEAERRMSCRILSVAAIPLALCAASVRSFAPSSHGVSTPHRIKAAQDVLLHSPPGASTRACAGRGSYKPKGRSATHLHADIIITTPTPDEAADMGARDWPQQAKNAPGWSESVPDDAVVTRYILSGRGTVSTTSSGDRSGKTNKSSSPRRKIGPGSLVEITGPANVDWTVEAGEEMIVLTPGYEEAGLLLGVAGAFVVLCGVLVATAGGS